MRQDQFEKLKKAAEENAYLSIAVSEDGTPVRSGPVPWEKSVSAFNMKPPKVTLAAADLSDPEVLDALSRCRIIGCYIFAPLEDYGFIAGFSDLADLFIRRGENIKDIAFVSGLSELFMFYLEDADIPDLEPLAECARREGGPPKCFGFRNCRIGDASALTGAYVHTSELFFRTDKG